MNEVGFGDKGIVNGIDSRYNLYEIGRLGMMPTNLEKIKAKAGSVACMIRKTEIEAKDEGSFTLLNRATLVDKGIMKVGEKFDKEPSLGFATAFLIGPKLMATAAHCVCKMGSDEVDTEAVKNTYIVFDFSMENSKTCKVTFPRETVYTIQKVVARALGSADWAIFELNDIVAGRVPLQLGFDVDVTSGKQLYMIGHPSGLPLKYTENACVRKIVHPDKFEADLNSFSGNSGSPVFDAVKHLVVGILSTAYTDFNRDGTVHYVPEDAIKRQGLPSCQRINVPEIIGLVPIELRQVPNDPSKN